MPIYSYVKNPFRSDTIDRLSFIYVVKEMGFDRRDFSGLESGLREMEFYIFSFRCCVNIF